MQIASALVWLAATVELWRVATAADRIPLGLHALFYFATLIFLSYFWLFSAHHLVTFMAWALTRPLGVLRRAEGEPEPDSGAVVIAYTCCNDFIEECANSCLALTDRGARFFVCDDSTDASVRARVDQFCLQHPRDCALLRRPDRRGFKAGNLNHLLRHLVENNFPAAYLLLADSDSRFPSNFLPRAVAILDCHPQLAFVQASHCASLPSGATSFQRALALGVQAMWRFLPLRNRFGMVPLLGHGAVLRMSALLEAGGFPIRISEDLALSVIFRQKGYEGFVLEGPSCSEGLPATFRQYRRRAEKWIIGAIEFILKDGIAAFRAPPLIVERIDLALSVSNILNALPVLVLLAGTSVIWPLLLGAAKPTTLSIGGIPVATDLPGLSLDLGTNVSGSLELGLLVCAASLASLAQFVPDFVRTPFRALAHVSSTFLCFCGILIPSFVSSVVQLVGGRYQLRSTGDESERRSWQSGKGKFAQNFFVGRWGSLVVESALASGALAIALVTHNLFLASVALGMGLSPILDIFGWDCRLVRPLRHLPFALFCLQIVSMAFPAWGAVGITSGLILFHF